MAQQARVGRERAWRRAVVTHVIPQVDGIGAAFEGEGLGHHQTLAVGPGERHGELVGVRGQRIVAALGRPLGQMGGRVFPRRPRQARLQQVEIRRVGVEQAHRHVRVVLVQRILQEVGAIELAAPQIDVEIEHIRGHVQRRSR